MTPLQIAAREGHHRVVEFLVSAGANIQVSTGTCFPPLKLAVEGGHLGVLTVLLDETTKYPKDEAPLQDFYDTALDISASEGWTDVLKYLLKKRTGRLFEFGDNLMNSAISKGHLDIIKELTAAGVEIANESYLIEAMKNNDISIAKYLIETIPLALRQDWLLYPVYFNKYLVIREILKRVKGAESLEDDYGVALQGAVGEGYIEVIREMIRHKDIISEAMDNRKLQNILLNAVRGNKNPETIDLFLENGWDPNYKDLDGDTALHAACQYQASEDSQKEIVRNLLKHSANPDETNREGRTPLHIAVYVYNGNVKVIKLLLNAGSNVNKEDNDGITALHIAAMKGNSAEYLIKLLLCLDGEQKGRRGKADVRARAKSGWTALHSSYNSSRITSILLSQSPIVDAVLLDSGYTPLLRAAEAGNTEVVKLLLGAEANCNATTSWKQSALHLAALNGSLPTVEKLFEAGAILDSIQEDGSTPLGVALAENHFDIADYLLDKGANPNVHGITCNSPLQIAVISGQENIVRRLLEKGVDVNAQCGFSGSALHAATFAANEAMVSLLLGSAALPDMMVKPFGTPLHAVYHNHFDNNSNKIHCITKLLVEKSAKVDCLDYYQRTPLMLASRSPAAPIAYLLRMGAQPNAKDNTLATALHYAAFMRSNEEIEEMLHHGGDPTVVDGYGRSALYWAVMSIKGPESDLTRKFNTLVSALPETQRKQHLGAVLHPAVARQREDVLNSIIEEGLDLSILDRNRWSALDVAGSYGFSDTMALLERKGIGANLEKPKRPSAWSSNDRNCPISLSEDGLEAIMEGSGTGFDDFLTGLIRTNYCIPFNDSFYYFEVKIVEGSDSPIVGVGVSEEHIDSDQFVGWDEGSWGYHGDDGNAYMNNGSKGYSQQYGTEDVIGCGIDFKNQTIFFTKNGEDQGVAFEGVRGQLYPTVSFQRQATTTRVSIRFGGSDFMYQRKEKADLKHDLLG